MEEQIQLPKRLQEIVDMIPESSCMADIGCDHAYTAIEAVRCGRVQHAIACDVRPGPLMHARENILWAGLGSKIETRLSDGLEKLSPGEADVIVIAGMGGPLMERILNERLQDFPHFILSPQSEPAHFRRFLLDAAMEIEEERMLQEDGKYYTILRVGQKDGAFSAVRYDEGELSLMYGGRLLARRDPVLRAFLEKEKRRYEGILEKTDAAEVQRAYALCRQALEVYER